MARSDLHERIALLRKLRVAQDRTRVRRIVTRRDGVRAEVDGRWMAECCGGDYPGLSQQFQVTTALPDAAARDGVGAWHLVDALVRAREPRTLAVGVARGTGR